MNFEMKYNIIQRYKNTHMEATVKIKFLERNITIENLV